MTTEVLGLDDEFVTLRIPVSVFMEYVCLPVYDDANVWHVDAINLDTIWRHVAEGCDYPFVYTSAIWSPDVDELDQYDHEKRIAHFILNPNNDPVMLEPDLVEVPFVFFVADGNHRSQAILMRGCDTIDVKIDIIHHSLFHFLGVEYDPLTNRCFVGACE